MTKIYDYYTAIQKRQQANDEPVLVAIGGIDNPETSIPVGSMAADPLDAAKQVAQRRARLAAKAQRLAIPQPIATRKAQDWTTAAVKSHELQQASWAAKGISFDPADWGDDD